MSGPYPCLQVQNVDIAFPCKYGNDGVHASIYHKYNAKLTPTARGANLYIFKT
jgi:hypothetical protein